MGPGLPRLSGERRTSATLSFTVHPASAFFGTWHLVPASCRYEHGQPPREGTYVLEPDGDGIRFAIDWVDGEGEPRSATHTLAFGAHDGLGMYLDDARTLTTTATGMLVVHARRELSADGRTMTIAQMGKTPEGRPFVNRSVYRRAG
jgi:hypothetical protein